MSLGCEALKAFVELGRLQQECLSIDNMTAEAVCFSEAHFANISRLDGMMRYITSSLHLLSTTIRFCVLTSHLNYRKHRCDRPRRYLEEHRVYF